MIGALWDLARGWLCDQWDIDCRERRLDRVLVLVAALLLLSGISQIVAIVSLVIR